MADDARADDARADDAVAGDARAVAAVAAWAGSTNLGDELVLAALLAKLAARGLEAQVASLDPPRTSAAHHVASGHLVATRQRLPGRTAGVVLGGGGLVQDETSAANLPYHLGRAAFLAGRQRPLVGVGLGAGPLVGVVGRRLVTAVLGRAERVSVRDEGSAQVLGGLGVPALVAADLAVSLPDPLPEVEGSPARLAVCLRPWAGGGGVVPVGARRRPPTTPAWFVPTMAAALDEVAAGTGLSVHFVGLQADRDAAVHDAVAAAMRTPTTSAVPDVHTVVGEIASCRAVVAMRYHAGIAALLGGRPAVLVGYSPKVTSLAAEVPAGFAGLAFDADAARRLPATLEATLDHPRAVIEGRERLRERERGNDEVIDHLAARLGA